MPKTQAAWLLLLALGLLGLDATGKAAAQPVTQEREFPKTLTFDEPGIDDEVSLPTLVVLPPIGPAGHQTDLDFEFDKRLTPRASIQVNAGYTSLALARTKVAGWQDVQVTLKYVVLDDAPDEFLGSFGLTRQFGGSGAARIGAPPAGSSMVSVNFGQGAAPFVASPFLKPFALTGNLGYAVPDRPTGAAFQQVSAALSAQYSLDVLASDAPGLGLPGPLRPLIPIVEWTSLTPVSGNAALSATLAPGLIYAGEGFQLAAEALIPLTPAAGRRLGGIAQLNISLGLFGLPRLSMPLWH